MWDSRPHFHGSVSEAPQLLSGNPRKVYYLELVLPEATELTHPGKQCKGSWHALSSVFKSFR